MTQSPKFTFALAITNTSVKIQVGISSCQLAKDLGITQKSAYKLLDDLRNSLKQSNFIKEMLKDFVEIDETYVGGRSWKDKTPTLVMIKRGGNAIAEVVPDVKQRTLEPIIRKYIKKGSDVYTDEWLGLQ
ncbi:2789_t:CDS:2 [Ambispora leptoticha]|uniref:2789_t:CDS:1 n=1 Tax=Ambispora leptoticha TaxID=144679 RepID=A0A9N9GCL0_9GLOM|nr:2789_t:CDS:2 [Ambispora leptoticha]